MLSAGKWSTIAVYGALLLLGIALLLWILDRGATGPMPTQTAAQPFDQHHDAVEVNTLLHVLLALVVVILAARGLGFVFSYLHQPPVIGEMIAGILLGPSLLGRVAPDLANHLLPPSIMPSLGVLSQVGVILFMFLVGLELDTSLLRKKSHSTLAISHASIVLPFVLGAALSIWLYPRLSTSDVPFTPFALFMGVAMSVTAFPVLARILTDRGLQRTPLGVIAISCAAVDDVSAWCLLAMLVGVAKSQLGGMLLTLGLTTGYIAFMLLAVRPWIERMTRLQSLKGRVNQGTTTAVFVGLLLSALATELIGIHALFGAFLLGAIIPHASLLAKHVAQKLEDLVLVLLLPVFFAFTGMRTEMGLLNSSEHWVACGLVIIVACIGKFGGSSVAARLSGLSWRDSACLGVLMNTRGLMQLIVLNVGLDLRILSPTLFAIMVIMALVTTFAAAPLLTLLNRGQQQGEGLAQVEP
jgi:Kef-type K+ transport system membrane component KefB